MARDALLIPFSLLWGGFAIFWESMAVSGATPLFFKLWGVPFIVAGLYLIAGRFALDAWLRGKTQYAVTDRRVLILRRGPFGKFSALRRDALPEMHLTERAGGRGTIRFGEPATFNRGFSSWTPALDPTPQFLAIADARAIFDLLQAGTSGTP